MTPEQKKALEAHLAMYRPLQMDNRMNPTETPQQEPHDAELLQQVRLFYAHSLKRPGEDEVMSTYKNCLENPLARGFVQLVASKPDFADRLQHSTDRRAMFAEGANKLKREFEGESHE